MKRKKKVICLLLLVLMVSGMAFMGTTMLSTNTEPATIDEPIGGFEIAAAATSDALGVATNNITNANGVAGALYCFAGAYEAYTLVVNASDADGYTEIMNITVEFVLGATAYGGFYYDSVTGVMTELAASATNVRIGAYSNISATNDVDLTVSFHFEWAMQTRANMDINITVMEAAASTELTKDTNIDIVATLTLSDATFFTYSEYSQNEAYGTCNLKYHYTGYTTIYPSTTETDFWVTRAAVPSEQVAERSWENGAYSSGIATWTTIIAASTGSGHTETFTLFAVSDGDGASGTTLMATTNTDTVIVQSSPIIGDRTTRDEVIPVGFDVSSEGAMVMIAVATVFIIGAYMMYGRNTTVTRKRRRTTKKRKTTKKKTTRRKKKR